MGTVTEVHDYLRVLYASLGVQHCPQCGRKVGKQSAQQIVEEILKAPTGSKVQLLAPLVVSWGWESDHPSGSTFVDHHEWQGTRDLAAYLATPAAIDWIERQDWSGVQQRCHDLLVDACRRVDELTGLTSVYADDGFPWTAQLAVVRMPDVDPVELKRRLYDEHRVETPVHRFGDQVLLRISIATYNTTDDVEALVQALSSLLPR